jgi:hypothetical protein
MSNGAMWRDVEWPGMKPLRCQSCGEQIGVMSRDAPEPDPAVFVLRCYACAATEEAESITAVSHE